MQVRKAVDKLQVGLSMQPDKASARRKREAVQMEHMEDAALERNTKRCHNLACFLCRQACNACTQACST